MTRRYCDRCGALVPMYKRYRVEVDFEGQDKPNNLHIAQVLCAECAAPAMRVVEEAKAHLASLEDIYAA